jgi:hypothetical protein
VKKTPRGKLSFPHQKSTGTTGARLRARGPARGERRKVSEDPSITAFESSSEPVPFYLDPALPPQKDHRKKEIDSLPLASESDFGSDPDSTSPDLRALRLEGVNRQRKGRSEQPISRAQEVLLRLNVVLPKKVIPSQEGREDGPPKRPMSKVGELLRRLDALTQEKTAPPREGKVSPERPRSRAREVLLQLRSSLQEKTTPPLFPKHTQHHKKQRARLKALSLDPSRIRDYLIQGLSAAVPQHEQKAGQRKVNQKVLRNFTDALNAIGIGVTQKLLRMGDRGEAERFYADCWAPLQQLDPSALSKGWKWLCSTLAREQYLAEGDDAVLTRLPGLLLYDPAFVLEQQWVRELVVRWLEQGEEESLRCLLFGDRKGKRGVGSYKSIMQQVQRDRKIFAEVRRRLDKGKGHNETMRAVAAELGKLGIKEKLAVSTVRKIYVQQKEGYDPRTALLPAPAR